MKVIQPYSEAQQVQMLENKVRCELPIACTGVDNLQWIVVHQNIKLQIKLMLLGSIDTSNFSVGSPWPKPYTDQPL